MASHINRKTTKENIYTLASSEWELSFDKLQTGVRLKFKHLPTGIVWADAPLSFRAAMRDSKGGLHTEGLTGTQIRKDRESVIITGCKAGLEIRHIWEVHDTGLGGLAEHLEISNISDATVEFIGFEAGPQCRLTHSDGSILKEHISDLWVPIPMRKHPIDITGGHEEFTAGTLISRKPDYWYNHMGQGIELGRQSKVQCAVPVWAADGWCWTHGKHTLVVFKHSPEHCEFSTINVFREKYGFNLRFGGTTLYQNMPGALVTLQPGESVSLGKTHYILVQGGWNEGYNVFRNAMDRFGYKPPKDYNPSVHWNQLYDMTSWYTTCGDTLCDRRQELYTLDSLWEEARKAREYHCESLYLDPGWDTSFASSIWDEKRLGMQKSFAERLRKEFGLNLALHCPMAAWTHPESYPKEAWRMGADGEHIKNSFCSGARQYLTLKLERLLKLCANGANFLMYDGTAFTGPCFDSKHGHPIPYTVESHAMNYRWLCDEVQKKYSHVLIELHDVLAGGSQDAILPKYFLHRPGWNVELWGNEYMWTSYTDLVTGKMRYLGYVRRAYSLPVYLHISLQTDNMHGLMFWYTASTCQHIGIGGTHPNPVVAAALKGHMSKYRKLKRFFVQGKYYAIDESVHLHVLPDTKEVVIVFFNFSDHADTKIGTVSLPRDIVFNNTYLPGNGVRKVRDSNELDICITIPPWGVHVAVLELRDRKQETVMVW